MWKIGILMGMNKASPISVCSLKKVTGNDKLLGIVQLLMLRSSIDVSVTVVWKNTQPTSSACSLSPSPLLLEGGRQAKLVGPESNSIDTSSIQTHHPVAGVDRKNSGR